jgi:ATP-dependent Clp protease protease subunit
MARHSYKDHADKFFEYGIHFETRSLYIKGAHVEGDETSNHIDAQAAENLIKGLKILENHGSNPITIYLNTVGGCVNQGFAIYDAIKSSSCEITVCGTGQVMSMGVIILQAADYRVLTPNTDVMIHDGENSVSGIARNFERWSEYYKTLRRKMYKILSERSGRKETFWQQKMLLDTILTAEQAVMYGLADKVLKN